MWSTPFPASARVQVIAGFVGLALAMGVGRFAFTPLFPFMQEQVGMTVAGGASLASANYLGYLIGAFAAMRVRVPAAAAIRMALVATAVSTAAMGLTSSFAAWLVLRGVAGVASAFLLVYVSAWTLERIGPYPLRRAALFSGVGAGIFLVGAACIGFSQTATTADAAWVLLGVGSFLLIAIVWRVFGSPAMIPAIAAPISPAVQSSEWRLVAAYCAAGFGYIIPATFLPTIARMHAASPLALDIAWPALGLSAMASTYFAARFTRGTSVETWRRAQALMALGVALPALSPTIAAVIVSGVCVGGTFMVVTMSAMQASQEFAGADARRLIGLVTAAFAAGQLSGPLIVAFLLDGDADFSRPLFISAAALAAGALVLRDATGARTALAPKEN